MKKHKIFLYIILMNLMFNSLNRGTSTRQKKCTNTAAMVEVANRIHISNR